MSKAEWDATSMYIVFGFVKQGPKQQQQGSTAEQSDNSQEPPTKMQRTSQSWTGLWTWTSCHRGHGDTTVTAWDSWSEDCGFEPRLGQHVVHLGQGTLPHLFHMTQVWMGTRGVRILVMTGWVLHDLWLDMHHTSCDARWLWWFPNNSVIIMAQCGERPIWAHTLRYIDVHDVIIIIYIM